MMPDNKTKKNRRKWDAEKKVQILQSHFNKSKIVDTCDEFKVHPVMVGKWWKTVIEAGMDALRGTDKREKKSVDKRIAKLELEIHRKNAVIAQLSEEVISLKKDIGEI